MSGKLMSKANWNSVGSENRRAAQLLLREHPRSCVSRAYYAAFDVLNERLLPLENPPKRYETHLHREMPNLIQRHLFQSDAKSRRALRTTIVRLYNTRLDADYHLGGTIDEAVALNALRDAKAIFKMLGVNDV